MCPYLDFTTCSFNWALVWDPGTLKFEFGSASLVRLFRGLSDVICFLSKAWVSNISEILDGGSATCTKRRAMGSESGIHLMSPPLKLMKIRVFRSLQSRDVNLLVISKLDKSMCTKLL